MKDIKNIIFDLGGVIINLDFQRTILAFNKISKIPFESFYSQNKQSELFNLLDKGMISPDEFFRGLKREIAHQGKDNELLEAWNAMLLDVPANRLEVLKAVQKGYRTFLLSNTCEPHITAFEAALLKAHGINNFNGYFEKVYYSCRMGMRKPDREIFDFVLQENGLNAEETIFIDDTVQHVKGAEAAGIKAYLLPQNTEIGDFLRTLNLL